MTIKKVYSTKDARTHFAKIITAVSYGNEEIFILRHDVPIAKICPLTIEEKKYVKNLMIESKKNHVEYS